MKDWFSALEPRERRLMIGAAAFLIVMLFYLLVWEPISKDNEALRLSYENSQQLIDWMEDAAEEAKALQAKVKESGPSGSSKNQSLLGIIDRTAKRDKLGPSVKRVQPDGKTGARVWIENAIFNDMIKWLENLQHKEGIRLVTTVIEKQEEPGLVNARLVFERAS
ncbi:type II secretion system protein GspM [Kaarinaea lacus]